MGIVVIASALTLVASARDSAAQTVCTGTLAGTHDNVTVNGGACTLSSATVLGSVSVTGGGLLSMIGTTQINGSIEAFGAGNLTLTSGTVLGSVNLFSSQNLTVGTAARLGPVNVTSSGRLTLRGTMNIVTAIDSFAVNVNGATITAGLLISAGKAALTICSSSIGGGVSMMSTTGALRVGVTAGCGISTIEGAILVTKGTGHVLLTNTTLAASDINVAEQIGNVILNNIDVSDLKVEKHTGAVTVTGITTDSDTSLSEISGAVTITNSGFGGDLSLVTMSAVTLSGNDFANESVLIEKGGGDSTISNNTNFGISVTERGSVSFSGNSFDSASFSKNTGGVSIVGNTGDTLHCVDNVPPPTGSGNTILVLASGQCAGF
jgi:hypothetical protein